MSTIKRTIFNETSALVFSRQLRVPFALQPFSTTSCPPPIPASPNTHPPTEGEDAPNHQSAVSHRRQGRRHAELSVSPDRTAVPSGYPHTSNLTPMIFTRCAENWKNTQEFKVSRVKVWTFSYQFVFQPLWGFFFHTGFCQWVITVLYSRHFSEAVDEKMLFWCFLEISHLLSRKRRTIMYFFEKQKGSLSKNWILVPFVLNDGQPATRGVNKARKKKHTHTDVCSN